MSQQVVYYEHPIATSSSMNINVWIIVITAIIFYVILSWYNALLFTYYYATGYNPNKVKDINKTNRIIMLTSIGYAIIWTVISVCVYYFLLNNGKLHGDNITSHPPGRSETAVRP